MTNKFKQSLMGLAVVAAMGLSASAQAADPVFSSNSIIFDRNGAPSVVGDTVTVNSFNWAPDTALLQNAFTSINGIIGTTQSQNNFDLFMQGMLSGFSTSGAAGKPGCSSNSNCGPVGASEFTFQLGTRMNAPVISGGTTLSTDNSSVGGVAGQTFNFYKMWYNVPGSADELAGTGYGNNASNSATDMNSCSTTQNSATHILILCGAIATPTLTVPTATLTFTQTSPGPVPLDAGPDSTDSYPGYTSIIGGAGGSATVFVDVLYQDNAFFKSNVASLTVDLKQGGATALNFTATEPSGMVADQAWQPSGLGSNLANDFVCSPAAGVGNAETCGMLMQINANTSFHGTFVPEPGVLALMALGLAGMGGVSRTYRRRGKAV